MTGILLRDATGCIFFWHEYYYIYFLFSSYGGYVPSNKKKQGSVNHTSFKIDSKGGMCIKEKACTIQ